MKDYNEDDLWEVFLHRKNSAGEFLRTSDGMRQVRIIGGVQCFRSIIQPFSGWPSFPFGWQALGGQCGDGI